MDTTFRDLFYHVFKQRNIAHTRRVGYSSNPIKETDPWDQIVLCNSWLLFRESGVLMYVTGDSYLEHFIPDFNNPRTSMDEFVDNILELVNLQAKLYAVMDKMKETGQVILESNAY